MKISLRYQKFIFEISSAFKKKNNMCHGVGTRFAKNNYTIHWPHKTGSRKQYKFVGAKTLNLIRKNTYTHMITAT